MARSNAKKEHDMDLDALIADLNELDIDDDIDFGEDDPADDDIDVSLEVDQDDLEDETVQEEVEESPKRRGGRPQKIIRRSKESSSKPTVANDPAPETANERKLIHSALDLRKRQIEASDMDDSMKKAVLEQLEYAKQVVSLFLPH